MYTLDLYNHNFTAKLTTLFYSQDIYDFKYTTEINKPGGASFSINLRNLKAIASNFAMYNKIIIKRNGVGVFIGYIENLEADVDVLDVVCIGMAGLFNKRILTNTYTDTIQTAFFSILNAINSEDDTGISQGVSEGSYNIINLQFKRSSALQAWQKLVNMGQSEFNIDTDRKLNFVKRLGTDKSSTVKLQYNIEQINSANLRNFSVEVQGKDMVNKVLGIRNGGSTYLASDATSIADVGVLEKYINYSQTHSSFDLQNEVDSYIDNHKIEFYAPKLIVNEQKIDINTLLLGDTVRVNLNNGFMAIDLNERIIKKEVKVSDNITEEVVLGLMPETSNLLPSNFFKDIITLSNRVSLLEGEL